MRVLLFGASGMVGAGVLLECLDDARVTSVVAVARSPLPERTHPHAGKLRSVVHRDFFDYSALQAEFAAADACFFCLGVSAVGMAEAEYTRLTYDLTLAAASAMAAANPNVILVYVSGAGTDSSGQGRSTWARVKGRTENALLALPFKAAYMFRPGFIQPRRGVAARVRWIRAVYFMTAGIATLLVRGLPRWFTSSDRVGRAMIAVACNGYPTAIMEATDINRAAAAG